MKQEVRVLKIQKVPPPNDAQLLQRMIELQKLREQVRLAEVATRQKTDTSRVQHR